MGGHRCTPEIIWRAALEALRASLSVDVLHEWDLDPATNRHATVPAKHGCVGVGERYGLFLGRAEGGTPLFTFDGLKAPWGHPDHRTNVWLNPPFSKPAVWVAKLLAEWRVGRCASITMLGPGDTSVEWWRTLTQEADAVAFWPRREHFPLPDQPEGQAGGGVHLWYFGRYRTLWRRSMEQAGCLTFTRAEGCP